MMLMASHRMGAARARQLSFSVLLKEIKIKEKNATYRILIIMIILKNIFFYPEYSE
jgi:hypothetical protein